MSTLMMKIPEYGANSPSWPHCSHRLLHCFWLLPFVSANNELIMLRIMLRAPQKTCTINDSKRIYYSVMQGTGLVVLPAEQARYGRLPGENIISRRKLRRRQDYKGNFTPKNTLTCDKDYLPTEQHKLTSGVIGAMIHCIFGICYGLFGSWKRVFGILEDVL